MQLTNQQKLDFYENGYLKIPGVVSPLMINAALHAINYSLGEEGMNKDDLPTLRAQSYCKEIRKSPAVTDLANKSAVIPVMESLLGKGNLSPIESGQIALRFPRLPDMSPGSPHSHLDGLGSGLNGSSKGNYRRGFTMLAVVLLNHLPETHSGNFTVWPKSHVFFLKTTFEKTELEFWPMGCRGLIFPNIRSRLRDKRVTWSSLIIKSSIQLFLAMHLTFAMLLFSGCVTNRRHSSATKLIPIFGENGLVFKRLPINCNRADLRLASTHEKKRL